MVKLKGLSELFKSDKIREVLNEIGNDDSDEVQFEDFIKVRLLFLA